MQMIGGTLQWGLSGMGSLPLRLDRASGGYARDMETGQGSGGHTCGETTANLTRDDYKQR